MQEAIGDYAEALFRQEALEIRIRVGLNSGEVVVRALGDDRHLDYSAVGDTTHLAARMEQLAQPGTTLMTAATQRFVDGLVEVEPLGPRSVKGIARPLDVYRLVGPGPVRSRLSARVAVRGLTRFVGRTDELGVVAIRLAAPGADRLETRPALVTEEGIGRVLVMAATTLHAGASQRSGAGDGRAGAASVGRSRPSVK
jgi:hypothetical protein